MSLQPGARLGPYEVVGALGAGGMGEVYRARDTRLDRSVALKVLPAHLAGAGDARQRFEQEARAISALQHPHVCALHDVGSQDGVDFLVMELLDGETLADRLARGPLPLAEALRCAGQVADALDRAHRLGIVHRDLKPANVMLTRAGVKLLDFGLARRQAPLPTTAASAGELSHGPTRVAPLTAEGTLLGTLNYMAPEQLEGRAVDARADLFAFGAMLYEMLTAERAFGGGNPVSVISAILRDQVPPPSARAPLSPPALDHLVACCLAKDPEERWQSAHDLRLELLGIVSGLAAHHGGSERAAGGGALHGRGWIAWALGLLALLSTATAIYLARRAAPAPAARTLRFELAPPAAGRYTYSGEDVSLAFSPDGSTLAFIATGAGSTNPVIWLRALGELEPRQLGGTEGATSLFWSPDGRSLGFFTSGRLQRLDLPAGTPVVLTEVPAGIGYNGSWGSRGDILYSSVRGDVLRRISAGGGQPEVVLGGGEKPERFVWPWYLPDGERFLYIHRAEGISNLCLYASGSSRVVSPLESRVELIGDLAVFAKAGALVAQPFDPARAAFSGTPVAVAPAVRSFGSTCSAAFATAADGTVVLAPQSDRFQLAWFDHRGGSPRPVGEPRETAGTLALGPDGRRAIVDRTPTGSTTYDLGILDLESGVESPLTSGADSEAYGVWSAGGKEVVYTASRGVAPNLRRRNLLTGEDVALLPDDGGFRIPIGVVPAGAPAPWAGALVFRQRLVGGFDLWSMPLSPPGPASRLTREGLVVNDAALSSDGQLLAFASTESGSREAYLRWLRGGETLRVSPHGALTPRFSPDGRTLYFSTPDRKLVAVSISVDPELRASSPVELFALGDKPWTNFVVAPDGRFLAILRETDGSAAPLQAIVGWRPSH